MADQIELRMNLAAIKRVDPYAKDIVDSSAHVAFYTFNSEESEWEKTDVEGAFFIYSRNAEPIHSIFINNRLNTNSFVEPITGQLELQSQPPFLLYRNERSRIRGFWFYNSSECDRIGELVGRLIKECEVKSSVNKTQEMMRPATNNVDIFTMLSKAQEDFNNAKGQSNSTKSESRPQPDVTSQSVMNFFAAAKPAAASEVPLFQRLLSNPVSVDQIEKQQRATTPQDEVLVPPFQANQELVVSPLAKFMGSSNVSATSCRNPAPLTSTQGASEVESNSQQKPIQQLLRRENSLPIQSPSSSSKPALMPPTMFLSTSSGKAPASIDGISQNPTILAANITQALNQMDLSGPEAVGFAKPEPLTQTQLLQAMLYLIKNDPDFIKKLHEAYLKSFTDMVSS
ncbi:unnamed protein product [Hermetia illucens]|uniref:mRNA-decapping enzyme C-terminal domain-containing protein n=1 Tax=Hermetia illucens TaxID=343691 RepID=A0A7R8YWE5_HERIL|nr:mRNA-decapping enzyme 1A [Hermetia illucens]CAD7087828.1 unnamed protein product [Hermetia illucens]